MAGCKIERRKHLATEAKRFKCAPSTTLIDWRRHHINGINPSRQAVTIKKYSPYLQSLYERIKSRRGAGKAIIAVARKLLNTVFYTLAKGWVFEDFPGFEFKTCNLSWEQRYWMDDAKTDFKHINPPHWALMLMLPCEQFLKADRERVWRNMVRKAMAISKEHLQRKDSRMDYEKTLQNTISSIQQGDGEAITRK